VSERLRILVVEDNPTYAEFVAGTLRTAGHEVHLATHGALARDHARAHILDAVVLDLGLPDESGYDVAKGLREVLPATAIIILLTAELYPQRDIADAVGIDMVISKPVEAELVTGLVDLVRSRRALRLQTE